MTWNERGPIVNLKIRSEILIQVLTIESGAVLEECFPVLMSLLFVSQCLT